jgi:hypothetical protein
MQDDGQPQPRSDGDVPPEAGPPEGAAPDAGQAPPDRARRDRPRIVVVRGPRGPGARPRLLPRVLLAAPTVPWAVLYFLATIVFLGVALGAVIRGQGRVAYGMENGEAVWAVVLVALLLLSGALTLAGTGFAAAVASRRTTLWAVLAGAAAVLTVVAVVIGVRAGTSVGWWLALSFGFPYAAVVCVVKLWLLARVRRPKVAAP